MRNSEHAQTAWAYSRSMPADKGGKKIIEKLWVKVIRSEVFCVAIGFLLGRALILSGLSPFIVPFFATMGLLKPKRRLLTFASLLAGAATASVDQSLYTILAVGIYFLLRPLIVRFVSKEERVLLPYIVFATCMVARLGYSAIFKGGVTASNGLLGLVEAGLAFLLTLIFLQSLPLLNMSAKKRPLKNEEIICFIILLSSVLTGTAGLAIQGIQVEHVLSRYLVLLFASVGGAAIGSTVGVVVGLILGLANIGSLYQMSLLAFSGLLGGLLKEGKRLGAGLGLMIGTLLIGLYGEGYAHLFNTTVESFIAILLLMGTPKSLILKIEGYIPGTTEYHREQQQYAKKLRKATASRVEQFSSLFRALSTSFSRPSRAEMEQDQDREVDLFLSRVTERTCQNCFKREFCWVKNFEKTYDMMHHIMQETEDEPAIQTTKLNREWRRHCVKPDKVVNVIYNLQEQYHEELLLRKKMKENRQLVADQLLGVSRVMGDFAKEIEREGHAHEQQEEQILFKLQEIGLDIENVDIYSLEEGAVDIDMTLPADDNSESEKIIAPILSDILGEAIVVQKPKNRAVQGGYLQVNFVSAKAFVVNVGASHTAKGGGWISGDNYTTFELGSGKFAVAISDGMGNGERASDESQETLKLLSKVLKSGIDETIAIKSINSILALRSTDDMFSTLDLAMIDLQNASTRFLKIGSNPSFIKRGSKVMTVEAGNLPMGIIQDFDVDVIHHQLKAGDLLVMMSDGIFDAPKNVENPEIWLKRKILELETQDPQEVADLLLEEVIRSAGGMINDDMTIVVSSIRHFTPEWAPIPTYTVGERMMRKAQ